MAKITGKYQLVRNVNFLELLLKSGIPEHQAKKMDGATLTLNVKVSGDKMSVHVKGLTEYSNDYILGKEVEETLDGIKLRSVAKLEGNLVTVDSKNDAGLAGKRIYNYKDSELEVVVISTEGVEAKRIYKRL